MLSESGTTKGSLYFHFPGGKKELAATALRQAGATVAAFVEHLARSSPDAATAVAAFAGALAAGLEGSDYERGCPLATSTLDAPSGSQAIRDACAVGYRSWLSLIAARLQADGWASSDAEQEAVLVLSALEGALVLARAERSPAPLQIVGRRLAARLQLQTRQPD